MGNSILRDYVYKIRKRAKYWVSRDLVELSYINLGGLRASSDLILDSKLYSRIRDDDRRILNNHKELEYQQCQPKLIFVSYSLVDFYDDFLQHLYETFSGVFIIDPKDATMNEKPRWINSTAAWASPNIADPVNSSGIFIPLGIEDFNRGNYREAHFSRTETIPPNYVLVGPFAQTHVSREIFASWKQTRLITVIRNRVTTSEYASLNASHRFTVCPRGNGIDTHRIWESLIRGSIPILERNTWSSYVYDCGLPIVLVESFSEILSMQKEKLEELFDHSREMLNQSRHLLSNTYWITKILAAHVKAQKIS